MVGDVVEGAVEDVVVEDVVADEDSVEDDEDAVVEEEVAEDEVSVSSPAPVSSSDSAPVTVGPVPPVPVGTEEVDSRMVLEWYRDELCRCSKDRAFVLFYRDMRVREVSPTSSLAVVSIVLQNGVSLSVDPNLIRIVKVDTSDEPSEVEFARYILDVQGDRSFLIGFRGSLADNIGSTEHDNVLIVEFVDLNGRQCRRLPAKALWVKKATVCNFVSANVDNSVINIVNDSITTSRPVVPTAAVLAAELLKRSAPPSVVGVPKFRKKL